MDIDAIRGTLVGIAIGCVFWAVFGVLAWVFL